jgi:hypothetical protein
MMLGSFATWTRRRWVVAATLLPVLAVAFTLSAPALPPWTALGWWAGLVLAAGVGSLVLASYVPLVGRGLDLGCTPCAAVSGVTLLGAVLAFGTYGASASAPMLAVVATGFGLMQRVTQAASCATPVRPGAVARSAEAEPSVPSVPSAQTDARGETPMGPRRP